MTKSLLLLGLLLATTGAARAQNLTLEAALTQADRASFANRMAYARAQEQSAAQIQALRGILPTLRFEGGFVRTTDPIGAFGTALRQRRIAQQDFDPARLNYPSAASNYTGAVVLEQPLFNADAHLGRFAAHHGAEAADAGAQWTLLGTRLDVIKAYYGAVLAREKAATLEAALKAARAHVDQAEKMLQAGLVTRSDVLLASVKAGDVEAELIGARGEARLARQQLALVLGQPGDTSASIPAQLPSYATVHALLSSEASAGDLMERADVRAAHQQLSASRFDVERARSLYLPRINGFARYDWNSPTSLYQGDKNWSVGVMASWTPFSGAGEWAERRAAAGRAAAATAGNEAARAQAALEIESAENERQVTLARLEIAQRGALQSAEAHRIVARKYDGGLGSVTELLDAAAAETQANLAFAAARYNGIVAQAARLRALGSDPGNVATTLDNEMLGASK